MKLPSPYFPNGMAGGFASTKRVSARFFIERRLPEIRIRAALIPERFRLPRRFEAAKRASRYP
jgi:hypothetical protein